MIALDPLETDTLSELVNIGVGRAAAALSEMIDQEVLLDVPRIEFMSRVQAADMLGQDKTLTAVLQPFSGPFQGDALLVFHETGSLELIRKLVDFNIPQESLTDLEKEALLEVGNIILNACLGSIANLLEQRIDSGMPNFKRTDAQTLLKADPAHNPDQAVLILHMRFHLQDSDLEGFVLFVMDIQSIQALKALLQKYLQDVMQGS